MSTHEPTVSLLSPSRRGARAEGGPTPLLELGGLVEGHYEIQALLGAGGMAQVYLAFDRWLGRNVAIKATSPNMGDDLAREARVLASFQHPGLVAAHSYGYHGGVPYVVLEHLTGISLSQRLLATDDGQRQPHTIDEALRLVTGLCEALRPLHARGLVHCDLKPGNVMITPERVVIIDLGLVWDPTIDGEARRSSGSPPFMAPEAIDGSIRRGEERLIDVYALGMILYAVVAGTPAFADDNPTTTMQRQLLEKPRPLASWRADLPPRLSELVSGMIDRDPARRPQTLESVRDALVGIPRRGAGPR